MSDLLRRLAEIEPTDMPVLSIYLDMRPQATGQSPGRRVSLTVLRDRFRAIEQTLGPRGDDLESFRSDRERIEAYLDDEFDRSAQGLAIFACSAIGLWETVESGVPFDDEVSVGRVPELYQLARLLDEQETAVVAVVDTNTARLFVTRTGRIDEVGGPDKDSVHHRKRQTGGWSQARYQRHIDAHHADFAEDAARAIERLVEREHASRVVLAGDEVSVTPLLDALPESVTQRVGEVARIGIRATRDDVSAEVEPVLRRMEEESSASAADVLVAAVRSGGLGVAGLEATEQALSFGQVDRLILAEDGQLRDDVRNELIRLATTTDAEVEVVRDHEGLRRLGGVGALLRYRID